MSHGPCHCGCGNPAPIAPSSHASRQWVRGQPMFFVRGHNRRGQPPLRGGYLIRNGVPIAQVWPDLDMLYRIHGNWTRVAQVLGIHRRLLTKWRYETKHLSWGTFQRIRRLVLGDIPNLTDEDIKRQRNTEAARRRRQAIANGTWVGRAS